MTKKKGTGKNDRMEKSIDGVEKDAGSSSSTIAIAVNVTTTQGWMSDKEKRFLMCMCRPK
jgi:hypothetical protein